jgi:hypothetical protein
MTQIDILFDELRTTISEPAMFAIAANDIVREVRVGAETSCREIAQHYYCAKVW